MRAVVFPVTIRCFLSKSPKLYFKNKAGEIESKKQRLVQRLSVTIYKETFN